MPEQGRALAIDGGPPVVSAFPAAPRVEPARDSRPGRVLERTLAAVAGVPEEHVVALPNQALAYRRLLEAGLAASAAVRRAPQEGDSEVIVPALLGAPAARAALSLGLTGVPADVDGSTATLTAGGLRRALGPRSAVAVAVHAFGHPAPVDELAHVAQLAPAMPGLALVEDASDAIGAEVRGVPAGRLAEAAIVAFGDGRLLTGGASEESAHGALLVLRDPDQAERVRAERDDAGADLDEMTARIVLAELREATEALEARRCLAWELTFALRGARALVPMAHGRYIRHAYGRYVLRLRTLLWKRDLAGTIAAIRAEGISCEPASGPSLHVDPAIRAALAHDRRLADDHFRAAARLPDELIALPLHAGLTSRDMETVANVLRHVERWST